MDKKIKWTTSPITKALDAKTGDFLITGYFTSDEIDEVGDVITKESTQRAVERFRKFPALRMMHQSPIGRVVDIGEPNLQWNQLTALVVDDQAKKLIANDVLTALSVGIIVDDAKMATRKDGKTGWDISGYSLIEVSAVDVPAQSLAVLTDRPQSYAHEATLFKAMDTQTTTGTTSSNIVTLDVPTIEKDVTGAPSDILTIDNTTHIEPSEEVECEHCGKKFDYLALQEEGLGYVKCPECGAAVDQTGKEISQDNGSKSMDEKEKEVPVAEVKTEVPEPAPDGTGDKLDKMLDMMGKMTDLMQSLIKPAEQEVKSVPEPTPEPSPVEKAVEPDVTKTEKVESDKILDVLDQMNRGFDAKFKEQNEALKAWTVEYIEKIRAEAVPGKAAMIVPEPEKTEDEQREDEETRVRKMTPNELSAYTRKLIAERFQK